VKVACLSLLWLCWAGAELGRSPQRSSCSGAGGGGCSCRTPDVPGSDDVPGPGSPLSRAEGTEQDNVLNSHIKKKKKSQCLLVPQGMVTTDLCV